jgi:branched-chain amino acid transport system permease protein
MNNKTIKYGGCILGLLVLLILPFISAEYPLHLFALSGIWIILVLSLCLLQGYIGELSMGHAAFFGIGAYSSVFLTMMGGVSFWIALPLCGLIAMIFGFLIGLVSLRLRGPYFAIVTLGFAEVIRIVLINGKDVTGGANGITGIPSPGSVWLPFVNQITFNSKMANYFLIYMFVILTIYVVYRIVNSLMGYAIIAIREDQDYAECVGINTMRWKRFIYSVSAFFAGLAGSIFAHYVHFISPYSFSVSESFDLIIMIIIGGTGTIVGPIIGAILLTLLPELLHGIKGYRMLIYGAILIITIMYAPGGIAGLLKSFNNRYFSKLTTKKGT